MSQESADSTTPPPAELLPPPPVETEKLQDLPHPAVELEESKPSVVELDKEEVPPPPSQQSKSLSAMMEKEEPSSPPPPPPPPLVEEQTEVIEKSAAGPDEVVAVEGGNEKVQEKRKIPQSLISFKEESNKVGDLSDSERKALEELKQLVQEALITHQFTSPPAPSPAPLEDQQEKGGKQTLETPAASSDVAPKAEATVSESDVSTELTPQQKETQESTKEEPKIESLPEEVGIWGIPLLKDDRTDVILLKFLRARDFKVKDAFVMFKNTIQWRKAFKIDELVDEDLGDDFDKVVFMHGHDREGHPVCYNVYGEFQNRELYWKAFSDEERQLEFLRCRIQFLERSIRKLDFSPGGISTIFQVNDLKNSPGPGKRELRSATRKALQLLQDNYPEFVAKQVFVNVPWWYLAFYTMISPFMTQRTKSKFVFASPSKTSDTLFKYISPEQVPVQYGGLSVDFCDCNPEFTVSDPVTELTVKPATKQTVEIIIYEKCIMVWELRVVGWEVSYGAEFVPNDKDAYTVIIQKPTKLHPNDEPVVSNNFKVAELGKIILTIDNPSSKKKRLLYRFKVTPLSV